MKLKTVILSLSFLLLSKTCSKQHQNKHLYNTFLTTISAKKISETYSEIFHNKEHEEELHIEEDLAILNTEPILFIAVLKQALSQPNPNTEEIKELIKNNLQFINFIDQEENTALSLAIEANNADIVDFLLEKGAKVIEKSKSLIIKSLVTINWSKQASYSSGLKIVKMLLAAGANTNFKEICGLSDSLFIWTPLRVAINIISKDIDNTIPLIINLLITYGADINERFQPTNTTILNDAIALSKYFSKKNQKNNMVMITKIKKVIKILLKKGAIK